MMNFFKNLFKKKQTALEDLKAELSFLEASPLEKLSNNVLSSDEKQISSVNLQILEKEDELELGIKNYSKQQMDEDINAKYEILQPYDPALDLKDYKYPNEEIFKDEIPKDYLKVFKTSSIDLKLPITWSIGSTSNNIVIKDLIDLKNIIVIGSQATGKTTFLNQLFISLLSIKHPSQLKFVLIDPKNFN